MKLQGIIVTLITPFKYCLKKLDLIESDEVRLPLACITYDLKFELDKIFNNSIYMILKFI